MHYSFHSHNALVRKVPPLFLLTDKESKHRKKTNNAHAIIQLRGEAKFKPSLASITKLHTYKVLCS
jgi:hypothetical protein